MNGISIHPSKFRPASDTSKPYKGGVKGKLAKKQKLLGARRKAHSATLADNSVKHKAGFKAPGSMKGR